MAIQVLLPSTDMVAPLIFLDVNGSAVVPGPVGVVTSDNAGVTPTLGADVLGNAGQVALFTSPAIGAELMLVWHDPAGKVPDFSITYAIQVAVPPPPPPPGPNDAVSGSFGPAVTAASLVPVVPTVAPGPSLPIGSAANPLPIPVDPNAVSPPVVTPPSPSLAPPQPLGAPVPTPPFPPGQGLQS